MISKLFRQVKKHRFAAGVFLFIIAGMGYWGYGKIFNSDGVIRYATAKVQNGTLIVSITGSGQVSAFNQVDIKPKASGEITVVYAKSGQEVDAGAVLAAIDSSDAERAVRDAETSLETAKLELDKILEPLDELTLLQAENSLVQAQESKQKAEDNLKKAYEDGFNTVANAFLNLPAVMTGLYDMLFSSDSGLGGGNQWNIDFYANAVKNYDEKAMQYKADTSDKYQTARAAYDKNFDNYKLTSRFSERTVIESLISETYDTAKRIAEAVKSANNLIQFYQDKFTERGLKPQALSNTHLASLNSYTGTTNSYLSSLLSAERSIQDYKESIVSAERSIEEKTLSLAKIKEGPDDLDIRAKKITIRQKEDAFTTAKQALANHYVRAPFAGVIAKVNGKKGDTASAGTAVATLVTKQKIAEVSLNEIDVAKIKTGQKATLTFDAVPDLTLTGQVAEVDAVGTVSQGVVTYTVKIGFDTQDDRVKTAMSVSAAIITEAKPNVLLVPNSAVKSQGGLSYVEVPDESDAVLAATDPNGAVFRNSLRRQPVEIGTTSDEFTEIVNGLKEGDVIVTRTIQSNTVQPTQQQSGGLRIPGLPGGGGGGRGGGPR